MPSILDTVSLSQQNAALRTFNPAVLVSEYLEKLPGRDKQILMSRYGLQDGKSLTLEEIGKKLNLTRERVRQIEKDALNKLGTMPSPGNFSSGVDLLFQIIEEHGKVIRGNRIFDIVLSSNVTEVGKMGILFILHLVPRFHEFKASKEYHEAWSVDGFDREAFEKIVRASENALKESGKPLSKEELLEKLKSLPEAAELLGPLSDEAVESYLSISKNIDRNPFRQWGLGAWHDIRPKDVGDKAYLVLTHHKRPEHYSKIAEMINKNRFDERIAQKATVHNELIKDERFVLVGRGIYALSSWGYQPGVVADIIEQILRKAQAPLPRQEIIQEVLKQRLVKKNTIVVGLSNKKRFKKTHDNKYTLTPKDAETSNS